MVRSAPSRFCGGAVFVCERKNLLRLEKYLKVSRVIKRRTLANEVADAGRVLVNGKPAKASYTVKIGDIIEVTFGNRPCQDPCPLRR